MTQNVTALFGMPGFEVLPTEMTVNGMSVSQHRGIWLGALSVVRSPG